MNKEGGNNITKRKVPGETKIEWGKEVTQSLDVLLTKANAVRMNDALLKYWRMQKEERQSQTLSVDIDLPDWLTEVIQLHLHPVKRFLHSLLQAEM